MDLMVTIIDLLERILSVLSTDPQVCSCQERVAFLLSGLLKAVEERNGIRLADILETCILEHELKPILADVLEHASECSCGG